MIHAPMAQPATMLLSTPVRRSSKQTTTVNGSADSGYGTADSRLPRKGLSRRLTSSGSFDDFDFCLDGRADSPESFEIFSNGEDEQLHSPEASPFPSPKLQPKLLPKLQRLRIPLQSKKYSTQTGRSIGHPDRFVPLRDTSSPLSVKFRTTKCPEQLSTLERLLRHDGASRDPFTSHRQSNLVRSDSRAFSTPSRPINRKLPLDHVVSSTYHFRRNYPRHDRFHGNQRKKPRQ